jgi:hypothetical protein
MDRGRDAGVEWRWFWCARDGARMLSERRPHGVWAFAPWRLYKDALYSLEHPAAWRHTYARCLQFTSLGGDARIAFQVVGTGMLASAEGGQIDAHGG